MIAMLIVIVKVICVLVVIVNALIVGRLLDAITAPTDEAGE